MILPPKHGWVWNVLGVRTGSSQFAVLGKGWSVLFDYDNKEAKMTVSSYFGSNDIKLNAFRNNEPWK